MASAKITYKKKPNKDGTFSIILQIIHRRKVYPKTICRVPVEDWDEKSCEVKYKSPNSAKLNKIIEDYKSKSRTYLLDAQLYKTPIDPIAFLNSIDKGADLISHLEGKKAMFANKRTRAKYQTCINVITENKLNRSLHEIDRVWISKFTDALKAKGNNPNTRSKYVSAVSSVFKTAKADGIIRVNPFEGVKKHSSPSRKAKLSIEEFSKLKSARLSDELEMERKFFVFITLARGMRSFDGLTLTWDNIRDGRLVYQAQKSAHDSEGKVFDIRITPDMVEILDSLPRSGEYVFPFLTLSKNQYTDNVDAYKMDTSYTNPKYKKKLAMVDKYLAHTDSANASINKKLKRIGAELEFSKKLTIHVARHTFAHFSDLANVPLGTIQQIFGHSSITTTKIYVESIRRTDELDNVVDDVLEKLN